MWVLIEGAGAGQIAHLAAGDAALRKKLEPCTAVGLSSKREISDAGGWRAAELAAMGARLAALAVATDRAAEDQAAQEAAAQELKSLFEARTA